MWWVFEMPKISYVAHVLYESDKIGVIIWGTLEDGSKILEVIWRKPEKCCSTL
jgi:hypothetical protein